MNGEDSEEGSKDNEDDDGEEGGKELLIVEGDCRVEYVKEKVGAELWERGHPFHVDGLTKDCPKNHPKEGTHKDENTTLWQEPLQDQS